MPQTHPRHVVHLVRLLALLCVVLSMTGCTKIVGDLAALPVKLAGAAAAETARLPFKVAEKGTRTMVQATLGNIEQTLFH